MEQIFLRRANISDLPALLRIEQSAFPKERWASEATLRLRLGLENSSTWLALFEDQAIGFANGFPIGNQKTQEELDPADRVLHNPQGEVWLLRNVAVRPEHQRRGAGKLLIQKQLDEAKAFGAAAMRFTATENLTSYYCALGFEMVLAAKTFHGLPQAVWQMKIS